LTDFKEVTILKEEGLENKGPWVQGFFKKFVFFLFASLAGLERLPRKGLGLIYQVKLMGLVNRSA